MKNKNIKKINIYKLIFFGIITLGFYWYFWFSKIIDDINEKNKINFGIKILFWLFLFGILANLINFFLNFLSQENLYLLTLLFGIGYFKIIPNISLLFFPIGIHYINKYIKEIYNIELDFLPSLFLSIFYIQTKFNKEYEKIENYSSIKSEEINTKINSNKNLSSSSSNYEKINLKKINLFLFFIFGILTLGFYWIYWFIILIKNIFEKEHPNTLEKNIFYIFIIIYFLFLIDNLIQLSYSQFNLSIHIIPYSIQSISAISFILNFLTYPVGIHYLCKYLEKIYNFKINYFLALITFNANIQHEINKKVNNDF